jgi:branched-chain amino acid aminotransferase
MPIPATPYIWSNGKLIAWEKATVHVLSHALHYGSSVFEGVRAYETKQGPAIFRLRDHTRRLFDSAKIYRMVPKRSMRPAARSSARTTSHAAPISARSYSAAMGRSA